jgi:hypothetical protein
VDIGVSEDRLKLREFCEAAAPCTSIDLTFHHSPDDVIDLDDLDLVAGSLLRLSSRVYWDAVELELGVLKGAKALTNMSQLITLDIRYEELAIEEPWGLLANLTSLRELCVEGSASGNPSALSALTRLTRLHLGSSRREEVEDGPAPFSFSSLQSLSTLQQLEVLYLGGHAACAATSLQGLAGLSNLKDLAASCFGPPGLISLEGISPSVICLSITHASQLVSLAGIEGCTSMEQLEVSQCPISSLEGLHSMSLQCLVLHFCRSLTQLDELEHLSALTSLELTLCDEVTSLEPLSQLGEGLQELKVYGCKRVQEEVLELPHVQPTADVIVEKSNVREVVLAGGLRRAVGPPA